MIKIKVLDEEYDVIDSWSDITLREFIEIQKKEYIDEKI